MLSPNRGEVWLVNLGMAAKVHPCLVLSVSIGPQDRVLATVVAHPTSPCGSRFEVAVSARILKSGVFDAQNMATVPHAQLIRKLGDLAADQLALVEEAIKRWLGL